MLGDFDLESMIERMHVDDLLALVVAHEDVRAMATAEEPLPSSWFDTIPVPTSPTVPAHGAARRKAA
jgi:hypothetical protein